MISFSANSLFNTQNSAASSVHSKNLAVNFQKLATTPDASFATALARITTDPHSPETSPPNRQLAAGRQNPSAPTGLNALVPPTLPASTIPATATPSSESDSPSSIASQDNAYWASQPAAVQPLRTMQSQSEREQYATQLAQQGYSVDVPVMVWGWDPTLTNQLRASSGYTWVPSGLQQNISEAPGLNVPGLTPYNPSNPPAGSILVG
jgi:hypothetical protein